MEGPAIRQVSTKDATGLPDLTTAVSPAEFKLISSKIVAKCDALDGATDGQVNDVAACRSAFNLQTDVPTCTGARDGSCITSEQRGVLASIFAGPKNSKGEAQYTGTWWDPGVAGRQLCVVALWRPATRDAGAVAFIFTCPIQRGRVHRHPGMQYALNFSMETDYPPRCFRHRRNTPSRPGRT